MMFWTNFTFVKLIAMLLTLWVAIIDVPVASCSVRTEQEHNKTEINQHVLMIIDTDSVSEFYKEVKIVKFWVGQ